MRGFGIGRHKGAIAVAVLAVLVLAPMDAYAECSFVPPWPEITPAVSSARDIVVGEVIDGVDPANLEAGNGDTEALRVTAVLRGTYDAGDLIGTEFLLPNWPWSRSSGDTPTYPSCSYLQALPGERIAIAFDALQPAQQITVQGEEPITWLQPATRYNAMGVLAALEPSEGWGEERERVNLAELEDLAGLPATDTLPAGRRPAEQDLWPLGLIAALIAGLLALGSRTRDIHQR